MLVLSFPQRQTQFSSQLGAVEERDVPGQVHIRTVKELAPDSALVQYGGLASRLPHRQILPAVAHTAHVWNPARLPWAGRSAGGPGRCARRWSRR